MEDSSTRSWNGIADDWANHADENDYKNVFLMPQTLALFSDVTGKDILDLGCGEGSYARALSSMGAVVTAVDGSDRLIEIAQERARKYKLKIEWLTKNANLLQGLDDCSFDYVLAAMSLMDVEDYQGSVSEIVRVLRPEGQLIMSILHPSFSGRKCKWWHDGDKRFDHYAVDDYFKKESWKEHVTDKFKNLVIFRHIPLQSFMNPLIEKKLRLVLFKEPKPDEKQLSKSKRLSRLCRVPFFLIMVWQK